MNGMMRQMKRWRLGPSGLGQRRRKRGRLHQWRGGGGGGGGASLLMFVVGRSYVCVILSFLSSSRFCFVLIVVFLLSYFCMK